MLSSPTAGRGRGLPRAHYDQLCRAWGYTVHQVFQQVIDSESPDKAMGHVCCKAEHVIDGQFVVAMLRYLDRYELKGSAISIASFGPDLEMNTASAMSQGWAGGVDSVGLACERASNLGVEAIARSDGEDPNRPAACRQGRHRGRRTPEGLGLRSYWVVLVD